MCLEFRRVLFRSVGAGMLIDAGHSMKKRMVAANL
eukprot:COSAG06_NODE_47196_length_341_cov_0.586777_1_plen_34_part_10